MPDTTRIEATAGVTTMPAWTPVMLLATVSVAVTDCVPAVLRVTLRRRRGSRRQ